VCSSDLEYLTFKPAKIKGKVFDKLFEVLKINQLTEFEMKTYNKSVLEYSGIRDAIEFAKEEFFEKGVKKGINMKNFEVAKKCLQKGMPIDFISEITGLTPEQVLKV
jgi:predicted transposase/invertase (TIGR01784 family)